MYRLGVNAHPVGLLHVNEPLPHIIFAVFAWPAKEASTRLQSGLWYQVTSDFWRRELLSCRKNVTKKAVFHFLLTKKCPKVSKK